MADYVRVFARDNFRGAQDERLLWIKIFLASYRVQSRCNDYPIDALLQAAIAKGLGERYKTGESPSRVSF